MNSLETGRVYQLALASADQAGWSVREAAWGFEERVLWRGSDATRDGPRARAAAAMQPLQRLIQTRLTWPLGDAFRAAGAGPVWRSPPPPRRSRSPRPPAARSARWTSGARRDAAGRLRDGRRRRAPTPSPCRGSPRSSRAGHAAPAPPQPPTKASAPPAQVAWQFAQASSATRSGGRREDRRRLRRHRHQATGQVARRGPAAPARERQGPRRRGSSTSSSATAGKEQVTASVSLVRLRAISEVRLTLTKAGDDWRVAQVLG